MNDPYALALWEEIRDQNNVLIQGQDLLRGLPSKVDRIERRLDAVEIKLDTVIGVITETNKQVQNHKKRITKLETTQA